MSKPSFRTKSVYHGDCEACGKLFTAANAMAAAAQHFDRCGGRIHLNSTVTFIWDPDHERATTPDREEA